jgi:hypothetical protein
MTYWDNLSQTRFGGLNRGEDAERVKPLTRVFLSLQAWQPLEGLPQYTMLFKVPVEPPRVYYGKFYIFKLGAGAFINRKALTAQCRLRDLYLSSHFIWV